MAEEMGEEGCPRCGAAGAGLLFHGRDYLSGDVFAVVRCDGCGVARTALGGAEPGRHYPPSYYGAGGRRFRGPLEGVVGALRRIRVRELLRHAPGPGRVLDVGCGRALMLDDLHRRGWTCVGTELSLDAVTAARGRPGFEILTERSLEACALAADSFQAITLWHSLEHFEEPWETLDEVARLLAPGGVVVVEIPNLASLQARLSRGAWFHLDVPRHLFHLSLAQLVEDLEARGLTVVVRRTFSLEYGPYGMCQSLLNLATRRPNVLYRLLRGEGPRAAGTAGDLLASALLLPAAVLLGLPLELAAAACRRGTIAHVMARKPR